MLSFPNAKINLGLNVLSKRPDGYHNIETVFYPIGWSDILEIVPSDKQVSTYSSLFKTTGIKIFGSKQKNLCLAAYHLLKENYNIPAVQMHLHKQIPVGSGLGGGSSDGAATLVILNNIFNLKISPDKLKTMASSLGADCAFFIVNKPVIAGGKGDEFEEITLDLSNYFIVVVKPEVHINTQSAYKNITPRTPIKGLKELIVTPIEQWKGLLLNDFEESVFKKHPIVRHIKEELYNSGAVYASMSGSGSAVYGIFSEEINETHLKNKFKDYLVWCGNMSLPLGHKRAVNFAA